MKISSIVYTHKSIETSYQIKYFKISIGKMCSNNERKVEKDLLTYKLKRQNRKYSSITVKKSLLTKPF